MFFLFIFSKKISAQENRNPRKIIAIKIDPISPIFFQHSNFGLEYSFAPSHSVELTYRAIGLGIINDGTLKITTNGESVTKPKTRKGYFFSVGYKYYFNSTDLDGWYVKPEFLFGNHHKYEITRLPNSISFEKSEGKLKATLINIGFQQKLKRSFIIEYFFGVGYRKGDIVEQKPNLTYSVKLFSELPKSVAMKAGINLGFTF